MGVIRTEVQENPPYPQQSAFREGHGVRHSPQQPEVSFGHELGDGVPAPRLAKHPRQSQVLQRNLLPRPVPRVEEKVSPDGNVPASWRAKFPQLSRVPQSNLLPRLTPQGEGKVSDSNQLRQRNP